ncbi:hypothetical protein JR316_0009982 [Psilocybe cubensis]|uniref:Uncharacterized protein n=2 Tax=Psilocybe cubensis TaxID=181762 RepID=A0A8H8CGY5_PSICU|nr:hypothetical protein JR316_0009982 [Psilocybe cubensis]KAH9477754.1 hypothetical protein JR316_0009982 [Psilocybe cubensis]
MASVKAIYACVMGALSASAHPLPILHRRGIDPSSDAWSETIAGIGPLILLVGEQSTKQLLCTVTGLANAFSLATAPLGLLSIVTSLIRLCGLEKLRAFIGHDLEARTVAAVEMTRVNCGGVYAELVDGYLKRNTNGNPAGVAIEISMLEGNFDTHNQEVVKQVMECDSYQARKRRKGIPDDCAQIHWCTQIVDPNTTADTVDKIVDMLTSIHGIDSTCPKLQRFRTRLRQPYRKASRKPTRDMPFKPETLNIDFSPPHSTISFDDAAMKLTYVLSFDAVSEFSTTASPSNVATAVQGLASMATILAMQFLTLWQENWIPSSGWILTFLGYLGIVLGVIGGSLMIQSSCEHITLNTMSSCSTANWVDGIIASTLAPESMDTSGNPLWSTTTHRPQRFEAVWRKEVTLRTSQIASAMAFFLVVSYVCHYLGLRALPWWVSSGELLICLLSAFVRSVLKDAQAQFKTVEGVKMDRRCFSTGVIRVQDSERIQPSLRRPNSIDVRAYDQHFVSIQTPIDGERIAWYIAREHVKNRAFRLQIHQLTGLFVQVVDDPKSYNNLVVFVSFRGGVLVEEGLAYPDNRMTIAFRCAPLDLGAPTPLLARALMRQPRWMVEHEEMKSRGMPLGNVYIFSINSMMNWWTISEDRNDMADFQKHLNWPMLLVNVAFFMSIFSDLESDPTDVRLKGAFQELDNRLTFSAIEKEVSEGIVGYMQNIVQVGSDKKDN